jgi:hypothetical protein
MNETVKLRRDLSPSSCPPGRTRQALAGTTEAGAERLCQENCQSRCPGPSIEGNDYLIMTGPVDTVIPINMHGPGGPFVIDWHPVLVQ